MEWLSIFIYPKTLMGPVSSGPNTNVLYIRDFYLRYTTTPLLLVFQSLGFTGTFYNEKMFWVLVTMVVNNLKLSFIKWEKTLLYFST